MTNTKNAKNDLTAEEILDLLRLHSGMSFTFTDAQLAKLELLKARKPTVNDVMNIVDLSTKGFISLSNMAVRDAKLIGILVADKLDISKEEWDNADKKVTEAMNEEMKKASKELIKKNREVEAENAKSVQDFGKLHVVKDNK